MTASMETTQVVMRDWGVRVFRKDASTVLVLDHQVCICDCLFVCVLIRDDWGL